MNEKAVTQDVESLAENTQRLLKAVADGDMELCLALIAAGANLNEPGKSVLLRVINHSYFNYEEETLLIRKLLKAGADVHINHDQPLIDAINGHHRSCMVEVLLDAGADVNARDGEPLIQASTYAAKHEFRDDIRKVELLLEAGADITARGGTPLKVSAKSDTVFGMLFYELMNRMGAKES